jgi:hypothetical protein
MYHDLLSCEAHQRIARIQREAALYDKMIDEAPLYFHTRNSLGDVGRFMATGVHRLIAALSLD